MAEGNVRAAEKFNRDRYPERDAPYCRIFINLLRNLYEYGSLRDNRYSEGGPGVTQILNFEQNVLNTVRRNPRTIVRPFTAAVGGFWSVLITFSNVISYTHTNFKEYRHCFAQIILCVYILQCGTSTNVAKKRMFYPTSDLRARQISSEMACSTTIMHIYRMERIPITRDDILPDISFQCMF